jgi:hypothetical protein
MVALIPLLALAQTGQSPAQVHKDKMHELAFMVGTWKGEGWQKRGEGKDTFVGTEVARWSAGGTALLIEGHQENSAGAERYNGLVVVTWNAPKDCYRFAQQTSAGTYVEYEAHLKDKALTWNLREDLPVTLTITDGSWLESASVISGDTKTEIFQLKMTKQPDIK